MGVTVALTTRDKLPVATSLGYEVTADVTFDASYAGSGGEPLTAATLLFPAHVTIVHVSCHTTGAFNFVYDIAGKKLIAYVITTGVEAAQNLAGLSTIVCHLRAVATAT